MVSYGKEAKMDGLYYVGADLAVRAIANIFSNMFSKKNRRNKKDRRWDEVVWRKEKKPQNYDVGMV